MQISFKSDHAIMAELDQERPPDGTGLDIIVVRHRLLGALVAKHQVLPIDSFLADSTLNDPGFHPSRQLVDKWWKELSSYGGHVYGFPFTALTTYLCYRKDLLQDAANQRGFRSRYHRELKVPGSWQEYLQVAEFFNRPGDHFYGTYIQGKQGLALWYEWLNVIYSFGGNILATPHGWQYGDIVVNSPQNVSATEQYLKLIQFSPPDTLKYGWNEAQTALQQGKVFMGLLWSDQVPFLENPKVSKVSGKIGYALIPSMRGRPFSQLEGLTYLVLARSQYSREAYKFLTWAMSQKVQVAQTLRGSSSVRKSTYDDPQVAKLPYSPVFLASVPYGIPKPTVSESDEMTQAMVRDLSAIVNGKIPVERGLNMMALNIQQLLGGKARLKYPVR
jgi:multiple sugar transport system substrate-binding protein